jgi:Sec-independent protein translocase protein TatA
MAISELEGFEWLLIGLTVLALFAHRLWKALRQTAQFLADLKRGWADDRHHPVS